MKHYSPELGFIDFDNNQHLGFKGFSRNVPQPENCLFISVTSDKRNGKLDGIFSGLSPNHDFQSSYCLLAWEMGQSSSANIQTTYDWAYQRTPLDQCKIGSDAKRGKNVICQKPLGGWTGH